MTRLLVLLAILSSSATAQPARDFFPWWEMPLVRDLNLTEDQMQKIQSTIREYRDRLVDLRGAVEKSENQLSDLMNDDHPDAAKGNAAIERVVNARGELTRAFSQLGLKLRLVLTAQQWHELQRRRPRQPVPRQQPVPPRDGEAELQGPRPPDTPEPPDFRNFQNPRPRILNRPQ